MYFVLVLGPAGSGKSYLSRALSDWMKDHGLDVVLLNLDPAAEWLPYLPDVDVRNYITYAEVMRKFNLGPNGALITSVDLIANYIDDIRSEIESRSPNYVVVDTPGQMEIFAFRASGKVVVDRLTKGYKRVSVFLIDSYLATRASALLSMLFLSMSSFLYLGIPQITVLSKADVLSERDLERIREWMENPSSFAYEISSELHGFIAEFDYVTLINGLIAPLTRELLPVSAITETGLDALYASIQRIVAGGEDFLTEEPSEVL